MPTEASFSMKLVWADEHLKALKSEVASFLQIRPYEIVTEKNVPPGYITSKVVYRHRIPDPIHMLAGDVLYNLRSSLDHLAWKLAGTSADVRTAFPIFIDEGKFRNGWRSGPNQMNGMPTAAQDIIQGLQPYQGRNGPPEPLWMLQCLNIEDKHHALNLLACGMDMRFDIRFGHDIHAAHGLTGQTGWMTFEDGTEIYRIPIPSDPSKMEDYSSGTFDIALDPKGPGRGMPLLNALCNMREAVSITIGALVPHLR
jgi:hypothetical protein